MLNVEKNELEEYHKKLQQMNEKANIEKKAALEWESLLAEQRKLSEGKIHQFETKIYKLKAVIDVKNNTLEQCHKQLQQMIQNCWQRVRSVDYQSLFRSPANSLLPGHLWSFCQLPGDEPSFISLNIDAYGVPGSSLSFLPQPVLLRITCNGLFCCQNCFAQNKEWKVLAEPSFYHGPDQSALGLSFIFFPCCLF